MEVDPRRLRFLLAVARYGGVLAAADELGVTASAVSQQIARLERETGFALLRRTPTGSELTPAGIALTEAAEDVERALALARSRLEQSAAEVSGTVRIGGFQSFLTTVLAPALPGWRERYPALRIETIEADEAALMRALRAGSIDALAVEFLGLAMTGYDELCGKGKNEVPYAEVPITAARDYSCADSDLALRLRALLEPRLAEHEVGALLREVELPLVTVLAEMEWTGVAIDVPWFHSLKTRFEAARRELEAQIHAEAGEAFNVASNQQLRVILFEKLGLPVKKKTATGPSTDASVLQELADEGHTLPTLLMEYRELAKLENTYLDTLPSW